MKNPLIDFLAAYGPVSNGQNMYDEFVVKAAQEAGVAPLEIEEQRSKDIEKVLTSDDPRTVILTGTAGDGKTYTARKVLDLVSRGREKWTNDQNEISIISPSNGRKITFVKDLSEIRAADKQKLVPRVVASLFDDSASDEVFVLCVNDGHLLKTLREAAGEDPRAGIAIDLMQRLLRDDASRVSEIRDLPDTYEVPDLRLLLLNMSRSSHAATLDRIIDAITGHSDWAKCAGCPALEADQACPIRINREILMDTGLTTMRTRLRSLIEIAAADDAHLSIRQIMILVVNALLGDGEKSAPPLLNCSRARLRAGNAAYSKTNPYANIFGENHPPRSRAHVQAFDILARFEIGEETNNYFDDALIEPDQNHPLPTDDRFGSAIFEKHRSNYQDDPSSGIDRLRPSIRDQRRRLFFLLPDVAPRSKRHASPWNLTSFQWGDIYLNLLRPEAGRDTTDLKTARTNIVKGMNRAMTGALTETHDALWLTQPGGVYLGAEKPMMAFDPIRWEASSLYQLSLEEPAKPGRPPRIEVHARGADNALSSLLLTPTLFEYLMRVAHGALPTSFTNQCYQDIRNSQIRTAGAIGRAEQAASAPTILKAVDTSGAELVRKPIILLEEAP